MRRHFRIIAVTLTIILMVLLLSGCAQDYAASDDVRAFGDRFELVSNYHNTEAIFVDKETGVMYYLLNGIGKAAITPLYNSDGTIMRYDLEENQIVEKDNK